jgi:hypothetical protein
MASVFTLTINPDTFGGLPGDDNFFDFTQATLQSVDNITGNAAGSFIDIMRMTASGTVVANQFLLVSNIEELHLATAGSNLTLSNNAIAGSSRGYFVVRDGAGDDTADGSGISNSVAIGFFSIGGTDAFRGGNGDDAFWFSAGDLRSADTVAGGIGIDALNFGSGGTVAVTHLPMCRAWKS